MKKRLLSITALLLALILMLSVFTGCGDKNDKNDDSDNNASVVLGSDAESSGLVILIGNHANAKSLSADTIEKYKDLISRAFIYGKENNQYTAQLQCQIIVCDGNPEPVPLEEYIKSDTKISSRRKDKREEDVDSLCEELIELLTSGTLKAKEEEVNLAKAINEGRYVLNSMNVEERNMLILDTFLPTAGSIDFTKIDIQKLSAKEAYDSIPDGTLPTLDGINVYADGVGNVAGSQKDYFREQTKLENNIIEFWKLVLGESLKNEFRFCPKTGTDMVYDSEDPENSYPRVSAIPFEVAEPETVSITTFRFDEVGFKPYSSEFNDKVKAARYIRTCASWLNDRFTANPDMKIYVVGSVARVDKDAAPQKTSKYSAGRAKTIADILIKEFDIPASQVITIDAGMTPLSWRNADEFATENEAEIRAAQAENRVVAIIPDDDKSSDYYQELVNKGYVKG